jgi:hypothetical protein
MRKFELHPKWAVFRLHLWYSEIAQPLRSQSEIKTSASRTKAKNEFNIPM